MTLTGIEWGNVADWFAAIGTILAIVASVWITRYQVKNDRGLAKKIFLINKNLLCLILLVDILAILNLLEE